MFNKKLLLIQNSLDSRATSRIPKISAVIGNDIYGQLSLNNAIVMSSLGSLNLRGILSEQVDVDLAANGRTSSVVDGVSSQSISLVLAAIGKLSVGGATSLDTNITTTASGVLDLAGQINMSVENTLEANSSILFSGSTGLTLPIIIDSVGSKIVGGSSDIDLLFSLLSVGHKYKTGTCSFLNEYNIASNGTINLSGNTSLVTDITLESLLSGNLVGSSSNSIVFGLIGDGTLESEVIARVVTFDLNIKQLQEFGLNITQLYSVD